MNVSTSGIGGTGPGEVSLTRLTCDSIDRPGPLPDRCPQAGTRRKNGEDGVNFGYFARPGQAEARNRRRRGADFTTARGRRNGPIRRRGGICRLIRAGRRGKIVPVRDPCGGGPRIARDTPAAPRLPMIRRWLCMNGHSGDGAVLACPACGLPVSVQTVKEPAAVVDETMTGDAPAHAHPGARPRLHGRVAARSPPHGCGPPERPERLPPDAPGRRLPGRDAPEAVERRARPARPTRRRVPAAPRVALRAPRPTRSTRRSRSPRRSPLEGRPTDLNGPRPAPRSRPRRTTARRWSGPTIPVVAASRRPGPAGDRDAATRSSASSGAAAWASSTRRGRSASTASWRSR